jgi:hypothetical protein
MAVVVVAEDCVSRRANDRTGEVGGLAGWARWWQLFDRETFGAASPGAAGLHPGALRRDGARRSHWSLSASSAVRNRSSHLDVPGS